jgi:hypothetical protein
MSGVPLAPGWVGVLAGLVVLFPERASLENSRAA